MTDNHPLVDEALKEGFNRFSVKVLLPSADGSKILLIRRAKKEKRAGQWDFPGGGADCLAEGAFECLERAAQREVYEEIGNVKLDKLVRLPIEYDCESSDGSKVRQFFYVAEKWHGRPEFPTPAEHDEMAWVADDPMDSVFADVKPAFQKVLRVYFEGLARRE